MKKITSIYFIFIIFLGTILTSFFILYRFSTESLKASLISTVQGRMEYSGNLLSQKIKEIEIEADGVLNSEDLKVLHTTLMGGYEPYQYVTCVRNMNEYLTGRQRSNVGMAEFSLFWPELNRVYTTSFQGSMEKEMLENLKDNQWFVYKNQVYFSRQYVTDWDQTDDDPYLTIKMERDYLYKIKNMVSDMGQGGTLLLYEGGKSLFPISETEEAILKELRKQGQEKMVAELKIPQGKYQILRSAVVKNGLEMVSYYPIRQMMKPVDKITRVTGLLLLLLMGIGLFFMILYDKNILLQLKTITEKLRQVENGDFSARITELPDNEFSYVFEQFNRMTARIGQLITTTLKEQQLRNQAELRQLQLQINPHFLYNSLSYIVTVANKPQAVTQMAAHLANYYRYCTKNKSIATIGEEVSYAKSYLSIMAMRKDMEYKVDVSPALSEVPIIPLLLQPVIENAIEHAIEKREHAKHIYVKIYRLPGGLIRFEISDDGNGMTEAEVDALKQRLKKKRRDEEESVGLWNINQRLINYYDETAELKFGKSIWGGLLVSFTILPEENRNESTDSR